MLQSIITMFGTLKKIDENTSFYLVTGVEGRRETFHLFLSYFYKFLFYRMLIKILLSFL